jgi:hypothetical protein
VDHAPAKSSWAAVRSLISIITPLRSVLISLGVMIGERVDLIQRTAHLDQCNSFRLPVLLVVSRVKYRFDQMVPSQYFVEIVFLIKPVVALRSESASRQMSVQLVNLMLQVRFCPQLI